MGLIVNFLQLLEGGMRIDFGGRETLVPQQFLNALQSGFMVQHRRGKSMTQHMRRFFLQRCTKLLFTRAPSSVTKRALLCLGAILSRNAM